jgi:hypothetical protein
MKKLFLVLVVIFDLTDVHGQNDLDKPFLASVKSKNLLYIHLEGKSGTVFKLGSRKGGHLLGYSMIFIDTIFKQLDTSAFYYSGKKTRLQKEKDKMYLIINPKSSIELGSSNDGH